MEKSLENIFLNAFETNKNRIFRICTSYSTDNEDAKDLFQEVLLHLWKSLPSFKNESNIDTWVYRITINVCLRAKQFSDKKQKHFIKIDGLKLENIGETTNSNEKEKQFLKLSECVKKLEGVEKSIILLYLEDSSYKEISQVLGLTENHVAVKIKRIKNKLLTCLKL
jgi:RNA polymerase sigma factor (sigma-70 family)